MDDINTLVRTLSITSPVQTPSTTQRFKMPPSNPFKLPQDWVRLVMDPSRTDELTKLLCECYQKCMSILDRGEAHLYRPSLPHLLPGISFNHLAANLVLNHDSFEALQCRPDKGIAEAAAELRKLLQKIFHAPTFTLLPFGLQEDIVQRVLRFDQPILEFGALYTNPRRAPFAQIARSERMNHLAITKVRKDFRKFKSYYVRNNDFAFLDMQGLVFFLRRVGSEQHENVASIIVLSPAVNIASNTELTLVIPRLTVQLFTNLTTLVLADGPFLYDHPGVNYLLEYLYALAAFRPSLKIILVAEIAHLEWTRFLSACRWLREPRQLRIDTEALCIGLARLRRDMNDPSSERGNPYFEKWFSGSQLHGFLLMLGGERAFPAVWANPGGIPKQQGPWRLVQSWGAWIREAVVTERAANQPNQRHRTFHDPQFFWPVIRSNRYDKVDVEGRADAQAEDFRFKGPPPESLRKRYIYLSDLERGLHTIWRSEWWPTPLWRSVWSSRKLEWFSNAKISDQPRLLRYPTQLRDREAEEEVQLLLLGRHLSYDEFKSSYGLDTLYCY